MQTQPASVMKNGAETLSSCEHRQRSSSPYGLYKLVREHILVKLLKSLIVSRSSQNPGSQIVKANNLMIESRSTGMFLPRMVAMSAACFFGIKHRIDPSTLNSIREQPYCIPFGFLTALRDIFRNY
ncbi:hypothetical protein SNE40_003749 [Patella caerulea]|uniref:Uncharacterized protein n=1 Tax=Patella caerulea TaxID=87958 RepID=A0AAN8K8K9_PATCE